MPQEIVVDQHGVRLAAWYLRAESDALRVQKRDDGRYAVSKPGAKRASAVTDTQREAIARARELDPLKPPIAKRVRKRPGAKRGTWRET